MVSGSQRAPILLAFRRSVSYQSGGDGSTMRPTTTIANAQANSCELSSNENAGGDK